MFQRCVETTLELQDLWQPPKISSKKHPRTCAMQSTIPSTASVHVALEIQGKLAPSWWFQSNYSKNVSQIASVPQIGLKR